MLNGCAYWLVALTFTQTAVTPCRKSVIPLPVASCAAGSPGRGWLSNWCPLTRLLWDAPGWQVSAAGGGVLGVCVGKGVGGADLRNHYWLRKCPLTSFYAGTQKMALNRKDKAKEKSISADFKLMWPHIDVKFCSKKKCWISPLLLFVMFFCLVRMLFS